MTSKSINEQQVIAEIVADSNNLFGLFDHAEMTEDFQDIGYSEGEAMEAASNVQVYDNTYLF